MRRTVEDVSQLDAPPPPGSDTPVPSDVVAAPRRRRAAERAADELVPQTAMQQRAERRERERRARALPPPVVNPMADAVPPFVAARLAWEAQHRAAAGMPQQAAPVAPGPPMQLPAQHMAPAGSAPPPGYGPPLGYAAAPSAAPPFVVVGRAGPPGAYGAHPAYGPPPGYGSPPGYAPHPPVMPLPPKRRLTRTQTRAALLGSLVGQTLLALATHLLVASGIVLLLWGSLSEGGTDGLDALEADSLTDVVAFWADPARLPVTILIVVIVTAAVAAAGCVASFLWHRSAGLVGIKRSIALAYATTTVLGSIVGSVLWPIVLVFGLFAILLSSASLTVGSMWAGVLGSLAVSVVLSGVVGMLFGWVYLLAFRPRPTWAQLEEEQRQAELDAERRAVEADADELSRVD